MIQQVLCALGFHLWGRFVRCELKEKFYGEMEERRTQGQMRECKRCGRWQYKRIRK